MQLIITPYTMTNEQLRQTAVFLLTLAGDEVVIPLPASTPPHPRKAIPLDVPPPPVLAPVASAPAASVSAPAASVSAPTAPVSAPTAPVSAPTAPVSAPTAPVSAPAASVSAPTAPVSAPAAPVSAPAAPVPTSVLNPFAPAKPHGVEVDVTGLPWDSRIHSRTKSKTNDGKWKVMRGIDPNVLRQVENELRNVMALPAGAAIVPNPVAPVPPVPSTEEIYEHPPLGSDDPEMDFPSLVTKVQVAMSSNKLSSAQLADIIKDSGLPSLAILSTRPDLIPNVWSRIDAVMVGM